MVLLRLVVVLEDVGPTSDEGTKEGWSSLELFRLWPSGRQEQGNQVQQDKITK